MKPSPFHLAVFLFAAATLICVFLLPVAISAHSLEDGEAHEHESPFRSRRLLNAYEILTRGQYVVLQRSVKRSLLNEKIIQPFSDRFTLELDVFDTAVYFDMEINPNLIHPNIGTSEPVQHRYYRGTATSSLGSGYARLTLIDDTTVEGVFVLDGELYNIKTVDSFKKMKKTIIPEGIRSRQNRNVNDDFAHTIVYRESDLETNGVVDEVCGVGVDGFQQTVVSDRHARYTNDFEHVMEQLQPDYKELSSRAFPSGCPSATKVLYMGVAADCTYVAKKGSVAEAKNAILDDWNKASALYETSLNIALGIVDLTHVKDKCGEGIDWNAQCSKGYTIHDRLSDFSRWRGKLTEPIYENCGLFHLMSTCDTAPTVGIAWLNMLCQTTSISQTVNSKTQYVSGTGISTVVDNEWLVVAHEIGHNFGADHDCTSSTCSQGSTSCCKCGSCDCDGTYIMNPAAGSKKEEFSPCSMNTMCSRSAITGDCLMEPGTLDVLNTGICGNGLWEPPNEECDCGGTISCQDHPCCYSNCTLKPGAECSDSNSTACCENCQIVQDTDKICRGKAGECDVPEYCSGKSALCPADKFVENLTPCNSSGDPTAVDTYCASGQCTNRDLQCKQLSILDIKATGYDKACPQFQGQCNMWCYNSLEGCDFFLGEFRNGTKCGNDGICNNGICSDPDWIGRLLEFIAENKILFGCLVAVVALILIAFLWWGCRKAGRREIKKSFHTMRRIGSRKGPSGGRAPAAGDQPPPYQPPARPASGVPNANRSSFAQGQNMQMQSRCPICQRMFANEAQLNTHLDIDH